MKKAAAEKKQWTIQASVTFDTCVVVEAATADEAEDKFDECDWADDGLNGASITDWKRRGHAKEDK